MRTGMDEVGMGFGLEWTRGVFSDEKKEGKDGMLYAENMKDRPLFYLR